MAKWTTLTDEEHKEFSQWRAESSPTIQATYDKCPGDELYQLSTTGQRVFIINYHEDGTMTVMVSGRYNLIDIPCRVFGITPEMMTPCELPAADEPTSWNSR